MADDQRATTNTWTEQAVGLVGTGALAEAQVAATLAIASALIEVVDAISRHQQR